MPAQPRNSTAQATTGGVDDRDQRTRTVTGSGLAVAVVVAVVGLAVAGVGLAGAVETAQSPAQPAASNGTTPIVEEITVVRGDNESSVRATIRYEIPPSVTALVFSVESADVEVLSTSGFDRRGDQTFNWTGADGGGAVTISHPVDEGFYLDDRHPEPVGGGPEWTVVARPETLTNWQFDGNDPGIEYALDHEGPGTAGRDLAYLGPHARYETRAGAQRVTLVVPENSGPLAGPRAIQESLAMAASLNLSVGREGALVIAAPTRGARWAPTGLTVGSDARISGSVAVAEPMNVWVHEYVHTQQHRTRLTPETAWLAEGAAQYYGALVNLRQNVTGPAAFGELLQRGVVEDVVLAEPVTWQKSGANYDKGALVVAALDVAIRERTDGRRSFADVMRRWSGAEEFDAAAFERALAAVADEEVARLARNYTTTTAVPSVASPSQYGAVFETDQPTPGTVDGPVTVEAGQDDPPPNGTANSSNASSQTAPGGDSEGDGGFRLRHLGLIGCVAVVVAVALFVLDSLVARVRARR